MGAEIRTHYPATIEEGMSITAQEAWTNRPGSVGPEVPGYLRETIEEIAFIARDDKRIDKRSGVSQRLPIACLESVVSAAEQRAARTREPRVTARVVDLYSALPAITGKLELEYEGELRGAETIARELVRSAVGKVFSKHLGNANLQAVTQWFETGNELKIPESAPAADALKQMRRIEGLLDSAARLAAKRRRRRSRYRRGRRICSRRPVGAQAHQPQRRARLLRRSPQACRAARTGEPPAAQAIQLIAPAQV